MHLSVVENTGQICVGVEVTERGCVLPVLVQQRAEYFRCQQPAVGL